MKTFSTAVIVLSTVILFQLPGFTNKLSASTSASPTGSSDGRSSISSVIVSREVEVQEGDNLVEIARRELGRAGLATLLAEYNDLQVSSVLTAGDIVKVPRQIPRRIESAEVVFVKGTVTAKRTDGNDETSVAVSTGFASSLLSETVELARNDRVYVGDIVRTHEASYASLAFSTGSVVNLQPGTVAVLDHLACMAEDESCVIKISTLEGEISSEVEASSPQPVEFRITTPYASAAVRGTIFDINAADKMLVGVTEGAVEISSQDALVPLPTGFGLSVEQGQAPGEPVSLLPAPVFKRIPARIAPGDTLAWWPNDAAAGYRVALSNDEAARQVLEDLQAPDASGVIALQESLQNAPEPGDYFVTVRPSDVQGLMGFKSNTRITLASIDPDVQAVNTTVVRENNEFLISVIDPDDDAFGYEIQISRDEAFTDPLAVDVNEKGAAIFRIDADRVFTRARVLIDPFTVSAFGATGSN